MNDSVVNQLLTKIDGVDALNNILLIGMTNRKDMLDEALLRPGRLEVQVEIGLPDDKGRLQILKVACFQACLTPPVSERSRLLCFGAGRHAHIVISIAASANSTASGVQIHTNRMSQNSFLAPDVDLWALAGAAS